METSVSSRVGADRRSLARAGGFSLRRLGLVAGLDFVEGPEGPVPVDVNWFPSYRSVPEAPRLLCEHVWAHLTASSPAR